MTRGRIELYADIVKECPNIVRQIVNRANTHYFVLQDAHALGLIVLPLEGRFKKKQIVNSTKKGIELMILVRKALKLCEA